MNRRDRRAASAAAERPGNELLGTLLRISRLQDPAFVEYAITADLSPLAIVVIEVGNDLKELGYVAKRFFMNRLSELPEALALVNAIRAARKLEPLTKLTVADVELARAELVGKGCVSASSEAPS